MLSNQQLYLVNHFALVARRHGLQLPDLKELLADEIQLRQWIDVGLAELTHPAVKDAAAKLAAALFGQGHPAAAGTPTPPRGASQPLNPGMSTPGRPKGEYRSAQHEGTAVSARERALALAALHDAAGPIASFIAEQIDALGPMSLGRYLDHAATLAQLTDTRRRALRAACGLTPD